MSIFKKIPLFLAVLLGGCFSSPHGVSVGTKEVQSILDTIAYQKDKRTGLCFGVTTSSSVNVNGTGSAEIVIIHVPCDAVEKFLGEKSPAREEVERRAKASKVGIQ